MGLGIATGLAIAAAYLTKLSNLPLIFVAIVAIAYWCFSRAPSRKLGGAIPALIALVCCAAVPIAAWMLWVKFHFGDFTGAASKAQLLGWTAKPISNWWSHPIFTLSGLRMFLSELIASFWRGEFVWHLQRMASAAADAFYAISSAIVILVAGVFLLRRRAVQGDQRWILGVALLSFLSLVAFLVLLSIGFDFGTCPYPSREHPYFTSGRLLDAGAVPFFLLFVYSIDRFGSWTK